MRHKSTNPADRLKPALSEITKNVLPPGSSNEVDLWSQNGNGPLVLKSRVFDVGTLTHSPIPSYLPFATAAPNSSSTILPSS